MYTRLGLLTALLLRLCFTSQANQLLISMDENQTNHLKAYGVAYWALTKDAPVDWLLNYRGGSFSFNYTPAFLNELVIRGVSYEIISDAEYSSIQSGKY